MLKVGTHHNWKKYITREHYKVKKYILTLILCVGQLVTGPALVATAAESPDTMAGILIIPFNIHAEKDQSFLKPAITDMLYTRLSAENRTVLVEKVDVPTDSVSAENAIAMGLQQNVDYVLFGSITMLGSMISTDAQLVGVAQEKPLLTFNEVGQDQSDIIAHMDHLTTQINETIFGAAKIVDTLPEIDQGSDDIHAHPEKLMIPDTSAQTTPAPTPPKAPASAPPAPPAPAIVMAPPSDQRKTSLSYWKSENFPVSFQGISIADVNGDGTNETVLITGKDLHIYLYENDRLQPTDIVTNKSFNKLIQLGAADINQNGRAEIFVTDYIASNKRLKSFALEWNGQEFEVIAEWKDLYLRVLHRPTSGSLLLGQKRGSRSSQDSIKNAVFDKDVFEMMWQDGQYKSGSLYPLPAGITLYDFSPSDARNNEQDQIVAFSSKGNITLYNQNGETTWKSTERYGGSRLYIEVPKVDKFRETIRYYLPHRIHVTDIDRDGLNEIIVLKNIDSANMMPRTKIFKEGYVACLSWDDIGPQLKWQTRKILGYISDYVIGDFNNDGSREIVMSVVTKKPILLSKGKSYIISCKLVDE